MNRLLLFSLLTLSVFAVQGCVDREAQATARRTQQVLGNPEIPVSVETTRAQVLSETLSVTGSLTSSDDTQVGAQVAGRIISVRVKDGDAVQAGEIIAVQDTVDARTRLAQAIAQRDAAQAQLRTALRASEVGPQQSAIAVRAARAQLAQAEAQLLRARNGARSEERRQADAQLQAAKVNLDIAKRDLDRGQKLLDEGAISERDFDRFRQGYAAALAQYETALQTKQIVENATRQEDLRALEQAVLAAREQLQSALTQQRLDTQFQDQVQSARAQLASAEEQIVLARQQIEFANVRAPFSGRVAGKPLQVGAFAGPGTPVVRIVGSEGIYFESDVPEVQISRVETGMAVRISVDALNGRSFNGRVVGINPSAESLGRLFKVRIQLDGMPEGLKAGMFARGQLELSRRDDVITLPISAVLNEASRSFVYVVSGGEAIQREVKAGLQQGGRIEITQGLQPGEQVIIKGQNLVQSKSKVRIEADSRS